MGAKLSFFQSPGTKDTIDTYAGSVYECSH